jgi:hypothetical protein
MTRSNALFALCSLLVTASPVLAQAPTPSPWAPVIDEVAKSIGALVGLAVLALGGLVLAKLREKFGIDVSAAANSRLQVLAQQAATYAEEKAGARLKAGATKLDSDAKLAAATAWLRRQNPALTEQQAHDAILSCLPFVGAGALVDQPPPQE